jgi:hypothetical protein
MVAYKIYPSVYIIHLVFSECGEHHREDILSIVLKV